MTSRVQEILQQDEFSKADLAILLKTEEIDKQYVFQKAALVKEQFVGPKVFFRGLIELTNRCEKNCYYCGIRTGNRRVERYMVEEEEVLYAARYAHERKFGSIVMQSGERTDKKYINSVTLLIRKIKELSNGELGITLSMG